MKRRFKNSEKRENTVSVRLNDHELEMLEILRGKLPKGEALREILLKTLPVVVPESNLETAEELRRIGLNLNQLARFAHEGVLPELEETRKIVLQLRAKILGSEP